MNIIIQRGKCRIKRNDKRILLVIHKIKPKNKKLYETIKIALHFA